MEDIKEMKERKATGVDGKAVEFLKCGSESLIKWVIGPRRTLV